VKRKSRREELLHTAFERGLIDAEQLEKALGAGGDSVDDLVRAGLLTREQLDSLALLRFLEAEPATESAKRTAPGFWDRIEGKRFGRYLLEARIGEGGTALVLKARDEHLNRTVALKVLKENAAGIPSWVERFKREARAMARLRNPNIIAVHDIGTEQGWHYFSMDYVAERPFREIMADPDVKLAQLLGILWKVARACHFAHSQGVVHRDLKPGNILVDQNLEPYVADFGIARLTLEKDERLTQTGTILGTAHYMSPEHVAGDPDRIDARSDVFSLGAIAYEAATGRPPFSGRGLMAVMTAIATSDPVRPRALVRSIPPDVEAVVMKALEKEPALRYATAGEFAEDLRRLREGIPVTAGRISTVNLFLRRVRKNRWGVAGAMAAALLLAVLAALLIGQAAARARYEAEADGETDLERKLGLYERAGASAKADTVRRQLETLRLDKAALERHRALREVLEPRVSLARSQLEEARRLRGGDRKGKARELASLALEALAPAVEADPGFVEAWTAFAKAHELLGNETRALQALDEAARETRGSVLVLIERAKLNLARYSGLRGLPPSHYHRGTLIRFGAVRTESGEEEELRRRIERDIAGLREAGPEYYLKYEALLEGALQVCRGEYEEGRRLLTEAIRVDRFEFLGWMYRGRGLFLLGRYADAELDWSELTSHSLAGASAWLFRGMARHAQGNLAGAIEDYTAAIELEPDFEAAYTSRGNVYFARNEHARAIREYSEALRVNPRSAVALTNRANCRFLLGDLDGAHADLDRALEFDPRFALAYSGRASVRYARQDYAGAEEDNTRALEIDPAFPTALNNRGNARFLLGKREAALEDFAKAIELDPEFAMAFANRGNLRYQMGDVEGAMQDYGTAILLGPTLAFPYRQRALRRYRQGDNEGALEDLSAAIERGGGDAEAFTDRGIVRYNLGDYEGALQDHSRAIELDSKLARAHNNRGNARFALEDMEGALVDFDRALELDARFPTAYYNRANVRVRVGEIEPGRRDAMWRGAAEDYRAALRCADAEEWTHHSQCRSNLADLLRRMGVREY
jgi:tetratricopeptide (TPR) repeat protein